MDQHFIDDERIVDFGEQFGPGAISAFVALLCTAKQAGEGGTVGVGYRSLARKAFLTDAKEAQQIVAGAVRLGLLEATEGDERVEVSFPRWGRYQRDPFRGDRRTTSTTPQRDSLPTGTVTRTGTETNKTADEFKDWLEHYHTTTSRESVRGSAEARRSFTARRNDGYSLADLKAATVGAHADDYCRKNGYDRPETILRPSKVERFIELGKKSGGRWDDGFGGAA